MPYAIHYRINTALINLLKLLRLLLCAIPMSFACISYAQVFDGGTEIDDDAFAFKSKMFCLVFVNLSNTYEFRKDVLEAMAKTQWGVDRFWTTAACRPNRTGGVVAPILHLVVEEVGGRRKFYDILRRYYVQTRADSAQWLSVVNAKNSQGHTVLDFIDEMLARKELRSEEIDDVVLFARDLCAQGARHADPAKVCSR